MSGHQRGSSCEWTKISIRPVKNKGIRQYQFTYWDGTQSIIKNYGVEEVPPHLSEALHLPFKQFHVQCSHSDLQVQITKKGKVLINRNKPSLKTLPSELPHNRMKSYLLPIDTADEFLIAIGIMDQQGRIKPTMQAKFRQINEFLRHIEPYIVDQERGGKPIHLVDCGCGSAYLTFAAYHYLKVYKGFEVHVTGIDHNEKIIAPIIKNMLQHTIENDMPFYVKLLYVLAWISSFIIPILIIYPFLSNLLMNVE